MLDNFLFGAATSAYQIEGAWNEDGKISSIWDDISHGKDSRFKITDSSTGDIACNHYHEWKNDVDIMKEMGLQAYRFSISWSRVQSHGKFNEKGIKFYQKLANRLIDAGIEPFATLYHWDLPSYLNDSGGWSNQKIVNAFRTYAEKMFEELPEIKYWITFNEPAVFLPNYWGHNNFPEATRNVLLAHGRTASDFHDNHKGKIGIALNLMPVLPNDFDDIDDAKAVENIDKRQNGIWLEPIFNGNFPKGINKLFGFKKNILKFSKDEKEIVSSPIDFLGVNYYAALCVKYNRYKPPTYAETVQGNFDRDEMGIEIKPFGLGVLLDDLKEKYNNPEMYITENGCACPDSMGHDGEVHDERRIKYMRGHLYYCNQAVKNGVNLKGYFYWSLMDNFEWLFGYTKRFGLLYIFYPTQSRVAKDSFLWYKKIIMDRMFREKEIVIE